MSHSAGLSYGLLDPQRQRSPKINFREIFWVARFSTFTTISACAAAKPNRLLDVYRNFIRDNRRVERVVLGVAQHELKGMLTGRKFDARLGLARSKMEM